MIRFPRLDPQPETVWHELGTTPRQAFRAFGMRRSGNHAIADWLLRNTGGSGTVFFNNCVPGRSPLSSFGTIAVNGVRKPVKAAMADLRGTCAPAGAEPAFLVTYEDIPPRGKRARPISGDFEAAFDTEVIIYRSFLNWCASFLKKLQRNKSYSRTHRASIVLKSVDGYARMLSLVGEAEMLALVPICYDDWQVSPEYRAVRLAQLGLPMRDNSIGRVQAYGGGSSFQDKAVSASDLTTDRRYEQMAGDPDFRGILSIAARDDMLVRQLEQHFPQDAERLSAYAAGKETDHG